MASDAAASEEMELAWHLLTVLLRLGRPTAASDLAAAAAAAVSPHLVELLCRMPGSPLRLSGGVVTASETVVVAFLRFVGWDVSVPRVSLRASEMRRWWGDEPIRYERKRKASDVGRFAAKRRLLGASNADLVEQKQQLIAQRCAPFATGEVHLEVMQELQDRIPTLGTLIVEPYLKFLTGVTLVPSVAKISMPGLQPQLDQFLGGNDGSVLGNTTAALLPKELSDIPCCINISSIGAEKPENIYAADNEISWIGEPEGALPFYNCRVEDSDDLDKESTLLPMTVEAALVGENKNGIEEDLNLVCKRPGSPINRNMKEAVNIERIDAIPDQAEALQYDSPNAGYGEKIPTCQEMNTLGASACAETHKNKTTEILFQSPTDTKAEPVEHESIHEMIESLCQPSLGRKVEPAALPVEVTGYDCIHKRNSNIIAENRESAYLNQGEQPRNEVGIDFSKKEQDRKIVKQREKSKKNDALPKEDKHQFAAKAQKGHVVPKPLPSFKFFVIEEEEGSGGYGTVYRARRKSDGKVFAIKCPHAKAHSHHVSNELKMLERFGGKNFVIKYECSFRNGDLECFVLEHVEHDRPEILKKEIDLFELEWYGYCLFKALASLHKQGIMHRDVKPGNFLFSRKLTKGYLIDFNLANDLHQKFLRN